MSQTTTKSKETVIQFPYYLTAYHHAVKHGIKNYKLRRTLTKDGWQWELAFKKETVKVQA